MGNQEQLNILKKGVKTWNEWRAKNPAEQIDLSGCHLHGVRFEEANLRRANLSDTYCGGADFIQTDLTEAALTGSDLTGAYFTNADLRESNLCNADFYRTIFTATILDNALFNECQFNGTVISGCETLGNAIGLETVQHGAPSFIDMQTLRGCINNLPEKFLSGMGYNQIEIDALRTLYGKAFQYYSCFISYARIDDDFANRLHADLQSRGISCWKDNIDLKGGHYWQTQVNEAIRLKDKVVLICSKTSLVRKRVTKEILEAIYAQKAQRTKKLFPIMIDQYVLSDDFTSFTKEQVATGEWTEDWLPKIRAFHIPDFSGWKNHDLYMEALDKLVEDLKKIKE